MWVMGYKVRVVGGGLVYACYESFYEVNFLGFGCVVFAPRLGCRDE